MPSSRKGSNSAVTTNAERLIGSIRRECLDHVVVLGAAHLSQILRAYADNYNRTRTHFALAKDSLSVVLSRRPDRSWPSHSLVGDIPDTPG